MWLTVADDAKQPDVAVESPPVPLKQGDRSISGVGAATPPPATLLRTLLPRSFPASVRDNRLAARLKHLLSKWPRTCFPAHLHNTNITHNMPSLLEILASINSSYTSSQPTDSTHGTADGEVAGFTSTAGADHVHQVIPGTKQEEGVGAYHVGGFHPVYIGEVYGGKYEVLRKLGYGGFSTVWLVKDQE